jgi:hypothetical protein
LVRCNIKTASGNGLEGLVFEETFLSAGVLVPLTRTDEILPSLA